MPIEPTAFWRQIAFGEDSDLELKEVRFRGARVDAPRRDLLADELAAFANANGGRLVLGVADDRTPKPLEPVQLDAVVSLVGEVCNDSIEPALPFSIYRVPAPGDDLVGVLVIDVPAGHDVHRSPGGYLVRRGESKRTMAPPDIRRLLQARAQSDAASTDTRVVADTGVNTLRPELWQRYASSRANEPAATTLAKLKFVKNEGGVVRATVGGILLASGDPREWLPNAYVQAVCYAGTRMDGNRQLDAQDITGPLDEQIRQAVRFVVRNRRVAARKAPARTEVPQYSERAVFEAVVNAVVHRDYAVSGSHIRLFMFEDRIELYSPGGLSNSMTPADMRTSQFTRNELLASRLGQCPVGDAMGAGERLYFIERRGEGIGVIEDETFALAGAKPRFELHGERELVVTIPAATLPAAADVSVRVVACDADTGAPIRDAQVLMLYPNNTYRVQRTDAFGNADFALHTPLPMTVLCAAPGFHAQVASYEPSSDAPDTIRLALKQFPGGGSLVIANRTGYLDGINGGLNPTLDNLDRTYLYADNVAINEGQAQPVHFKLNEPLRLTDALGNNATVWFREMRGASTVFDYTFDDATPYHSLSTGESNEP